MNFSTSHFPPTFSHFHESKHAQRRVPQLSFKYYTVKLLCAASKLNQVALLDFLRFQFFLQELWHNILLRWLVFQWQPDYCEQTPQRRKKRVRPHIPVILSVFGFIFVSPNA